MKSEKIFHDLITHLVINKDDVDVQVKRDDRGVLFTLSVHPKDMCFVIGRSGRTVQMLRYLLHIAGRAEQAKISLIVNDPV